jgi:Flp pilus assembly secretin CpaC
LKFNKLKYQIYGGNKIMAAKFYRGLIFISLIFPISVTFAQNDGGIEEVDANGNSVTALPNATVEDAIPINQDEEIAREKIFKDAQEFTAQGDTLAADGKDEEADAAYIKAEEALNKLAGDEVDLREMLLRKKIASFRIAWAHKIKDSAYADIKSGEYDAAIIKLNQAQQIDGLPKDLMKELQYFIDLAQKRIADVDFKEKTSLEYKDVAPDYQIRNYKIDVALRKAKILLKNKQYMKARDAYERILVQDAYNFEATHAIRKIYRELRRVGNDRRKNDELERAAEVMWKWSEAVLPTPSQKPKDDATNELKNRKNALADKLNNFIIKNIDFTDADISAVVKYLGDESKKLDPEGRGINIILGLSDDELSNVPTVTMNFENIPFAELVRYLCQETNLKYRVDSKVLTIGTSSIDPMDTRFFKVRSALITRMGADAGDTPEAAEEEDAFASGLEGTFQDELSVTKKTNSLTSEAMKSYFEERGVPFPEGSTIAYDKRAGKIVVRNTPQNLRRLDTLLRALDMDQPQVLIESKFVETRQKDLEEIGFEWWFSNSPPKPGVDWTIAPNNSLVRPLGKSVDGILSTVGKNQVGAFDTARILNNVQFPLFGGDENYNVGMMLHALDQHDSTEMLSAPKVIAKSGDEAVIRMVREEYYPESWTEPELAVINTYFSYTPAYPEFGDPTDVGIRLIVTPNVSPNNYTISLALNPQVLALVDWSNYNIIYTYPTMAGQSAGSSVVKMPQVVRRDVITNVKVYDGDTIVLGGMLTENSSGNDDRMPGVGNVPLAGFLGRVQTSFNDKRNLLIFVTARIVNPDGLPVRRASQNGLFDFRR